MKCPFCDQEIKQLAVHIKDNHPKKLEILLIQRNQSKTKN